jgi:hypothetical protein
MNSIGTGQAEHKRITTVAGEERVPYEGLLRAIGLYLDEQRAKRFNLLEVTDGMVLRYLVDGKSSEPRAVHFEWDELFGLGAGALRRRSRRGNHTPENQPGGRRGGYQDILRLLGHELEKVPAYTIALDELEVGILTTYLYLDPAHGYLAKKRMVVIPAEQENVLLTTARARRARVHDRRWGIRLFTP